ncbi:MAG: lipid-A-disaccharide synthase [bacterium]
MPPRSTVFVCACEPSGDLYASFFVKHQLNEKNCIISGVGGPNLKKAGIELIFDYENLTTLGFASAISSSLRNYEMYRKVCRKIYTIKPEIFVAVAYPGLNLLLSRYAKKLGARVIYLLPPQIWAWGTIRKYFIKKWTNLVISVFPFEYQFYNHYGIKTAYWHNPLFEELKKYKRIDFDKRIGLMPGSRLSEIKKNLPVIMEVIKRLKENAKHRSMDIKFCLILHSEKTIGISDFTRSFQDIDLRLITRDRYHHMVNCDLIITCSGTASLEAGIMNIPQIFFNRPGFVDYYFFRRFLRIKEYNLTNLYFGETIVPSFVMRNNKRLIEKVVETIIKYFENPDYLHKRYAGMQQFRQPKISNERSI